jgi:ribonuclease HI
VSELIEIWTDGGCHGNPGPGAWAFVIRTTQGATEGAGYESQTTNNRMELTAVREALSFLSKDGTGNDTPIVLSTDSQYVQKGITQWIHSWLANGWRTTGKQPVKNADLWRELWALCQARNVGWRWVMGHAGNPMNEACHRMVEESLKRRS